MSSEKPPEGDRELTNEEISAGVLTPDEAAVLLGISSRMVRRHCQTGLGGLWHGRWYVRKSEILNFENQRRTPGRPRKYEAKPNLAGQVVAGLLRRKIEYQRNAVEHGVRFDFIIPTPHNSAVAVIVDTRASQRDQARFEERRKRFEAAAKAAHLELQVVDRETKFPAWFKQFTP